MRTHLDASHLQRPMASTASESDLLSDRKHRKSQQQQPEPEAETEVQQNRPEVLENSDYRSPASTRSRTADSSNERTPTNHDQDKQKQQHGHQHKHVTRSAENLLDGAICDVNNDTPVPVTSRVSRSSTIRAAVSAASSRSAESSPRHGSPALTAKASPLLASARSTPVKRASLVPVEAKEDGEGVGGEGGALSEDEEELSVDVVEDATPTAEREK